MLSHRMFSYWYILQQSSLLQDVLVNVTDLSHPQFYAQKANVQHVLEQLQLTQGQLNSMITVLNKADKVYGFV